MLNIKEYESVDDLWDDIENALYDANLCLFELTDSNTSNNGALIYEAGVISEEEGVIVFDFDRCVKRAEQIASRGNRRDDTIKRELAYLHG